MKIGIIGGTGPQGQGLALRFGLAYKHLLEFEIIIGSRDENKAKEIAEKLNEQILTDKIAGSSNYSLIKHVDMVIITVPFESVKSTLEPLIEEIKQYTKILIDVTVPTRFEKGKGMVHVEIAEGSMAELIQNIINPVPVVAAFKTIGAHALLDIVKPLNRDTFVMGPKEYRMQVIDIIKGIESLNPIDAGPLSETSTIERMVPFLININRRYKVKDAGLKIVM